MNDAICEGGRPHTRAGARVCGRETPLSKTPAHGFFASSLRRRLRRSLSQPTEWSGVLQIELHRAVLVAPPRGSQLVTAGASASQGSSRDHHLLGTMVDTLAPVRRSNSSRVSSRFGRQALSCACSGFPLAPALYERFIGLSR